VRVRRSIEITQGRAALLLKNDDSDDVDIISFVPEESRIEDLLPIYVALEEGLVGYRVCLIKEGQEERFKGIKSVKHFNERGLVIGQGAHWPDAQILRDNGLSVMTNVSYEPLFEMLAVGRFQCFLRGAHEVMEDYEKHQHLGLTIEPSLVFVYPSVSLFFVHKDDVELSHRIELGLRRALIDGDFKKLFEKLYGEHIEALNLSDRRVIRLNNTLLDDQVLDSSSRRGIKIDGKIEN